MVAIRGDAQNIKEFIENIILKDGEDARGIILKIVPIILRIPIRIAILDLQAIESVFFKKIITNF